MIRKLDDDRHSALYCPYCGYQVANGDETFRLTYNDIIECDKCGFEAGAIAFSFQPRKTEQK